MFARRYRASIVATAAASVATVVATVGVMTAAAGRDRLPRRLPGHQPVAGRVRRRRHRHQPGRPHQRLDRHLELCRRAAGHPGVERHDPGRNLIHHGHQRRLQPGNRHQRLGELRLQRLVERIQPRADGLHPQRHGLHGWDQQHLDEHVTPTDHAATDHAAHRPRPRPPRPRPPPNRRAADCRWRTSTAASSASGRAATTW